MLGPYRVMDSGQRDVPRYFQAAKLMSPRLYSIGKVYARVTYEGDRVGASGQHGWKWWPKHLSSVEEYLRWAGTRAATTGGGMTR